MPAHPDRPSDAPQPAALTCSGTDDERHVWRVTNSQTYGPLGMVKRLITKCSACDMPMSEYRDATRNREKGTTT